MLRGVFFDLDDTLIDQRNAAGAAVVQWAAELGVTGHDVRERWARIAEVHYARYQAREITFVEQCRERVRDFLERGLSAAEADRSFAGYQALYEAGWNAFEDAAPALRRARARGLTVVVFTNGNEEQQRLKLDRVGLSDEVDMLIASSMLPYGKPDPSAFRSALDMAGMEPAEALMVGDSLEKDVRGALSTGMRAVLLDRPGSTPREDVVTVRSLLDLEYG